MAWQFFGFMEGRDAGHYAPTDPPVYGPLPCKRWVPVKGERYRKQRRRPSKALGYTKDVTGHMAVEYARWLAARDGIKLPDGTTEPLWTRTGAEKRVHAVKFSYREAVTLIPIPHWDWTPDAPREEIPEALAA